MSWLWVLVLVLARPAVALELRPAAVGMDLYYAGATIVVSGELPVWQQPALVMIGPRLTLQMETVRRQWGVALPDQASLLTEVPYFLSWNSAVPLSTVRGGPLPLGLGAFAASLAWPAAPAALQRDWQIALREQLQAQKLWLEKTDLLQRRGSHVTTVFHLPSAAPPGDYQVLLLGIAGGEIVSQQRASITVRRLGLMAWNEAMVRDWPWLYALLCIGLAWGLGWLGGRVRSRWRPWWPGRRGA